jgi:fumarate reductase (CoM/CoB) subunit A
MDSHKEMQTDVLIIGSEAAGARAAIELADRKLKVLMVTKSIMAKSAVTIKAVFSVSGAFGFADPRDNPEEHMKDTVVAGRYLNNQKLVEIVTAEGPERLDELGNWGVKWDKAPDGRYLQVKMYGHSYPRSLAVGFGVGVEWMRVLKKEVARRPLITLKNDLFVTNYFKSDHGAVNGALAIDIRSGDLVVIKAKAILDATGGGMYLYRTNSATPESTGDGYAMGYRTGAELMDMEFVQFYPIQMYYPPTLREDQGTPAFVRTFLRGKLYNLYGERFMRRYDPEHMELADRDVLARAIFMEIKQGRGTPHGGVWLDASYLPAKIIETVIDKMAPNWTLRGINLLKYGIDLRKDPLEVGPVAHFFCGGFRVNKRWETNIPGFFAAGEVVGGANGANRLPGNALEETQVSAVIAGKSAAEYVQRISLAEIDGGQIEAEKRRVSKVFENPSDVGVRPIKLIRELQNLMWDNVGVLRNGKELEKAVEEIERIRKEELPRISIPLKSRIYNRDWIESLELANMLDVGEMIARSALFRTESRGCHYRDDFPKPSRDWLKNIILKKEDSRMALQTHPVVVTKIPLSVEEG